MISRGSEWHRWEPHIHAPGTILNNQFGAGDPWGAYLTTLESLAPKIEAIAVTDYYVTDTYEELLRYKASGRLPDVQLIFPNIELRLGVAAKSGFVNIHLLISPEDPDHLTEVKRILKRLQFHAYNDRFDCTRDELIKLGKRADPTITDDAAALRHGATQFKVDFGQLRKVIHESEWAKKNILIAAAGGAGDGTSGVRQAADAVVRQEIEKFAHIIFSSSLAQREFWLGQRPGVTVEDLRARYDGCKPCLHGSDSHSQTTVGQPAEDRFSWIKGALEFDALRQACIDPEGRAYVGEQPPPSIMPSQAISLVAINDADWATTPSIPLNSGLIAIIGARGSGKTALADVIAAGCDAISPSAWHSDESISASFLSRAQDLMGNATTTLTWGSGDTVTRSLDGSDTDGHMSFPRARYLSQQFVEELCSATVPLISDTADVASLPLAPITAEMTRLEAQFSADKLVRDQYSALTNRIAQENSALQTLEVRLNDAQGAASRRKELQTERDDTYGRVFEAIINEQTALSNLYAPLVARLSASSGTLRKLSFSVRRIADVEKWGSFAEEELLDRRKSGPFNGRGSLIELAKQTLKNAWETGSASEIQTAMAGFMATHLKDLLAHAPFALKQQSEFRAWSKQFAHWLFSTDHISVRYEISYDGVDIRHLSPGTRGVVLLLLYLSLDDSDDRPLIIDQPEENLDPKSVFDELVPLFIAAKARRQVIMVTHNANLVINTDADQIIVAKSGPHPSGGLPPISYMAGGLESVTIRKAVCDILEGGEAAFRERARRLRVHLDR